MTAAKMKPRNEKIAIGTVATLQMHSDRVVYVVTGQSESGITLTLKRAQPVKGKGRTYWIAEDHGDVIRAKKDHRGVWRQLGHRTYKPALSIGIADEYRDPSF